MVMSRKICNIYFEIIKINLLLLKGNVKSFKGFNSGEAKVKYVFVEGQSVQYEGFGLFGASVPSVLIDTHRAFRVAWVYVLGILFGVRNTDKSWVCQVRSCPMG